MSEKNTISAAPDVAPEPRLPEQHVRALGHDPFAEIVDNDPFGERLDWL